MRLTAILRFCVDDPGTGERRRFVKSVGFDVPGVPRIGERMVIPSVKGENLGAHRIIDLIYTPTGTVIFEFELEGLLFDADQQIQVVTAAGFREVPEPRPAL